MMELDFDFGRKARASFLAPGYHADLKKKLGRALPLKNGGQARLLEIEFQLQWADLSRQEKSQLKALHGADAKKKFHRFTRLKLGRVLPIQLDLLSAIDRANPDAPTKQDGNAAA